MSCKLSFMANWILTTITIALLSVASACFAEEQQPDSSETKPTKSASAGNLSDAAQNPIGAMYSLPMKFTADFGAPNGSAQFLNIQPVIPVTIGDWNFINRIILPLINTNGQIGGTPSIPSGAPGSGALGLGDINYSLFVSPAKPGKVIWGIGPSITFPSATDSQLGSGKWSAGPTVVLLTQPKPWTIGILGRQLWSFAGQSNRKSVNQFLMEPFINYNLTDGWYLLTDMILTANWNEESGQQWTVPIGGGVGKLMNIGGQAINTKIEVYYNAVRPDNAPSWSLGFTLQFMFPK